LSHDKKDCVHPNGKDEIDHIKHSLDWYFGPAKLREKFPRGIAPFKLPIKFDTFGMLEDAAGKYLGKCYDDYVAEMIAYLINNHDK
jgi:hypothetical protein